MPTKLHQVSFRLPRPAAGHLSPHQPDNGKGTQAQMAKTMHARIWHQRIWQIIEKLSKSPKDRAKCEFGHLTTSFRTQSRYSPTNIENANHIAIGM